MLFAGLLKLLLWLLHPNPESRATIPDLLMDQWTNQPVDKALMYFSSVLGMYIVVDRCALFCGVCYILARVSISLVHFRQA